MSVQSSVAPIRDEVIANAALAVGHRELDVGCGDGLIAFTAAEAVGPTGQVILCDVSADLLDRCRNQASQRGLIDRCRFVQAAASDQFHRVLRPGARLSLCSGNPRIPTPAEAIRQVLTDEKADRLTAHLRPLVEQGHGRRRTAVTYLWARRPPE